jgi:DNA-directed RNA polymerase subunit RPC12/RpoP
MTWLCTECGKTMAGNVPPARCRDCGDASFVRWQPTRERSVSAGSSLDWAHLEHDIPFPNGGLLSRNGAWS